MDMKFGDYSMLSAFGLALQSCTITAAVPKRYAVDVAGADGEVDLSDWMGEPRYEMRTLTAVFRCTLNNISDCIESLINRLEGKNTTISLPGDSHYITGRVHIQSAGNCVTDDIIVTASCMPWRYAQQETEYTLNAINQNVESQWVNNGRRPAVPMVTVTEGNLHLASSTANISLAPGVYHLPELLIPGHTTLQVTASGGVGIVQYREAIL